MLLGNIKIEKRQTQNRVNIKSALKSKGSLPENASHAENAFH
jgi:hypothetical protein